MEFLCCIFAGSRRRVQFADIAAPPWLDVFPARQSRSVFRGFRCDGSSAGIPLAASIKHGRELHRRTCYTGNELTEAVSRKHDSKAASKKSALCRKVTAPCPYQKPRRATTRSYSYCMPVTFRNNSKGKRPATKN